ncbi:DUF1289 domain-containing protein [Erwinia sp. OLTSP20]|uniref:DUF1289 domain-containing protein n=1 Tax=unclassified Erwinia TaxID=2622719 RepID=UPI000C1912BE|nr:MULTISPECIES: DUF1289 domain-containing protein [unclassified Erwinia]PIJ51668.1 DUF1289 domain-containing protein [Erwinia sp. OAMSP11]PIJ75555.1 DUF1289 domain-containing protein [Erwinia sp. OLSSP12]PIJ84859.1 DUF1289 domain-containing protein [Erwinia sp. OLCASP19]PIJ86638.1 DUF1289 domain-containing protein [Erwinia sp. OLMTSP26]PIJ88079.1 DUF1289 domain-containing protein [Erwinia sp. OLMDSP33]
MAEQLEFFPVPSPCRGICQADARGYCRGCLRSREERFNWSKFTDSEKREVLRLCRQRFIRMRRAAKQDLPQDPAQPSLF